jgi:hypothetical protein
MTKSRRENDRRALGKSALVCGLEKKAESWGIQPWSVGRRGFSWLLPLQENELGTEGRTHGSEDAVGTGLAGGVDEDVFEDGEN